MNTTDQKLLMAIEQAIKEYLSEIISIEDLKELIRMAIARHSTQ